jgi:uncharacterized protein with PQ loop repeat
MKYMALIPILTTVLSIAVKIIGLPAQIKNNHRRKTTEGLSISFMVFTLLSYAMWVVHGVQIHDNALVIGQGLGVVASGVIIYQMFIYRKNRRSKSESGKSGSGKSGSIVSLLTHT